MPKRGEHRRRSFVLIAVLVIGGSALLVATGLLFLSQADITASAGVADAARSRALAWSGTQAVMSSLNDQRRRILQGEQPELEDQYEIYETETRLGVIRLLPLGTAGRRLIPEAGMIDLNSVDAETLEATGLVDEPTAAAIIACRDGTLRRPFQSVAELLRADGITPTMVYGPIDELTVMDEAQLDEGDILERISDRLEGAEPRGLADLVTVYAFEPDIQRSGRKRINLNVPWSDELGRRIEERFGQGASQGLKSIFDSGTKFESDAKIFEVLRFFDVPPEDWPDIIDAITTEPGDYHFGRLDINTAPLEAMMTLPGLTPEQASRIVDARRDLGPDEKSTVAWPAIAGIVEPEAYGELAGRITTRCWTYRLRIAAGEVDADEPDAPLENPVIYEIVIDLSAPQPRVAYLRDVTMLQTAALLASAMPAATDDRRYMSDEQVGEADEAGSGESEDDWSLDFGEPAGFDDVMTLEDLEDDWAYEEDIPTEEEPVEVDDAEPARSGERSPNSPDTSTDDNPRQRIGRWRFGR